MPSEADDQPPRRLLLLALSLAAVAIVVGAYLVDARRDPTHEGASGSTPSASSPSSPLERPASGSSSTTTTTATTTALATTTTPTGRFVTAPGSGPVHGSGPLVTYTAEVEEGSGWDPVAFATIVDGILADPRGWTATDHVSFQRVEHGGSITISLATPTTTDQICLPLRTNGQFSCREGARAILNLHRWNEGTADLPLDVDDYRAEVVNHEVGHTLGKGHVGCGGAGLFAPVMMQQSKGLAGCIANPWPTQDGKQPTG